MNLKEAFLASKLFGNGGGSGGGSGLPSVTSDDNGDVLTVVDGAWDKAAPSGGGGLYIEYSAGMPSINATYNDIVNAISNGHSVYLAKEANGGRLLYSCNGFMGRQGNYMVIFVGVLSIDGGSGAVRGEQLPFASSTPDGLLAPMGA